MIARTPAKTIAKRQTQSLTSKFKGVMSQVNADDTADLWIYGIITDIKIWEEDITAMCVVAELAKMQSAKKLRVHINSPGGDVFDGLAIYNTLKNCGKEVETIGEGIVASIASVIAMAGKFSMMENSLLMVHNPLVLLFGGFNKHDMAKMADELDKVRDSIIGTYVSKTGMTEDEVIEYLDGEDGQGTYLTPNEALELGFCDEVIASTQMKTVAMVQPRAFTCKGRTLQLDTINLPGKYPAANGGNEMAKPKWWDKATKALKASKRQKFKNELMQMECPDCHVMLYFDTDSETVHVDPAEDATVAVPLEAEATLLRKACGFKNALYKCECPKCSCEFNFETEPTGGEVSESNDNNGGGGAYDPLVMARRKATVKATKKKAKAKKQHRAEVVPVDFHCDECGEDFTVDIDTLIEEVDVECPSCHATLSANVEDVEPNDDAEVYEVDPDGDDDGEENYENAYHAGKMAERKRMTVLAERANAYPQYAKAIMGFMETGTSVESANDWILQALAKENKGGGGYHAAAMRDAAKVNSLGQVTRGTGQSEARIMQNFESLAKKRGIKVNE